ncbi:GNAT family N-acetyltransferase [Patescibacteria group bacterium]
MENLIASKIEKEPEIKTSIISKEELLGRIYKGESLPQDKRFLAVKKGGVFKYFKLDNLTNPFAGDFSYAISEEGDKITGLAELQKSADDENIIWMKFLSIDPEFQGKRHASKVAREVMEYIKDNNLTLEMSSYSSREGWEKLKPLFRRLSDEYEVEMIDEERKMF